jgi:hypothetical protein
MRLLGGMVECQSSMNRRLLTLRNLYSLQKTGATCTGEEVLLWPWVRSSVFLLGTDTRFIDCFRDSAYVQRTVMLEETSSGQGSPSL